MRRAVVRTALTIAALLAGAGPAMAATPVPPTRYAPGPAAPSLAALVTALGAGAADAADARFAYLRKLDSHLQTLAADRLRGRDLGATARREALALSGDDRRVQVDVSVLGDIDGALGALRAQGMDVAAVSDREPERMVEGMLPVGALTSVAGLASTRAVLAVQGFGTNAGSVLSQGDAAHRGPQARALGPTGAGVKVGIVSDSINRVGGGVAASQATGNLPASVQVLQDGSAGSSDEGRAMAEIVYDTAPGITNMAFSTGEGAATRAAGIDSLVAAGAKVIADDTFQITEPFFQDGVVAQAVDRAKAAGVTYLVSAGNRARQAWMGTYAPMTDPRGISSSTNDFGGSDPVQTIGTFTNRNMFVSLQWDEPFGHATTDLAVDVYDGGVFQFTTNTDNIATGIPSEFVSIAVPAGSHSIGIAIRRVAGTRNPIIKYVVGGTQPFTIAEHDTSSSGIDPDASSARGALTVAASNFATPATPEAFSSRGSVVKFFDKDGNRLATPDTRFKPDLSAADGVATSVPGFSAFFGTSAAAPSAAGVAALVLSAKPSLSVDEVAAILRDPTKSIDCTSAPGLPDEDCGFGFVLADAAVQAALDPSPPVVAATLAPAVPNGANGWYSSGSVGVSWATSDAQSPIETTSGCDAASVTTDGTATFTCRATSIGGTTTQPVIVKLDTSPPSAPSFSGIAATQYAAAQLPAQGAIACAATDPTSGVSGCAVSGYSAAVGGHTLTATATNGAGLTSTSTLAYTVLAAAPPVAPTGTSVAAISGLRVSRSRLKAATVAASGVSATLTAARAATRLKVTVSLRGKTIATLSKTVGKGTAKLKIRLTRAGRIRLRSKPGTLAIAVTGSAAGVNTTTLRASLKTRR